MANEEHLKILKQGVEVWNKWREENPDEQPDLSGKNFLGMILNGANLVKTDFSGSYLGEAFLSGAKLISAKLIGIKYGYACRNKTLCIKGFRGLMV